MKKFLIGIALSLVGTVSFGITCEVKHDLADVKSPLVVKFQGEGNLLAASQRINEKYTFAGSASTQSIFFGIMRANLREAVLEGSAEFPKGLEKGQTIAVVGSRILEPFFVHCYQE